jgi:hypothetical protein
MGFVYTEAQGMEMGSPQSAKQGSSDTDDGGLGMSGAGAGGGVKVINDIIRQIEGREISLGAIITRNGKAAENPFWKIYISIPREEEVLNILNTVVPHLVENNIFFQVRGHINDSTDKFITVYADSASQAVEYWTQLKRLLSGKESALKLLDYEYGLYNTHYEEKRRASYMPAAQNLKKNEVGSILVEQRFIPVGGMNRGLPQEDYQMRLNSLIQNGLYAEAAATVVLGYKSGGLNPHLMEDGQKLGFIQNILAIVMGMKNVIVTQMQGRGLDVNNHELVGKHVRYNALRTFLPPSMFTQNISQGDWEHALVCAAIASAAAHEFTRSAGTFDSKPKNDDYIERFRDELQSIKIQTMNLGKTEGTSPYLMLIQAATGVKFKDLMEETQSVFNKYWSKLDKEKPRNDEKKRFANALLPKPQSGAGSGSGGGSSAPSGASPARHMSDVTRAVMSGHNPKGGSEGFRTPSPQRRTP